MCEFEDNLWLEVVREHGDQLARTQRTGHTHRWATRPQLLAGTTVGLAATATAAALLLGASTSPPAFAVTRNPDGTITVNVMKLSGVVGANEKLAAMGVRAQIAALAKHAPKAACPGGTGPIITFDPASIPKRHVLVITQPNAAAAASEANQPGSTGRGKTGAGATSGGGNHVIRKYPGGGQIRTYSGSGNRVVQMYCP